MTSKEIGGNPFSSFPELEVQVGLIQWRTEFSGLGQGLVVYGESNSPRNIVRCEELRWCVRLEVKGMFEEEKVVGVFVFSEKLGSMFQIGFGFPSVFQQWLSLPCSQVLVFSRRSTMGYNALNFVFFFGSNQIWRW